MFDNFSFMGLRERYQRLTQREQLMLVLVLGAALYFIFDWLVFAQQKQREQALLDSQVALQSQVIALSAELATVDRALGEDLEQKQKDYQRLKKKVDQLDALVASITSQTPQIKRLVSELLGAQKSKIKAVSVKTLPAKMVLNPAASKPGNAGGAPSVSAVPVYRHGVDVELRGSYLDLMAFLQGLEEATPNLYWSNATLNTDSYPENTLRVSLFLLSAQSKL